MQDGPNTESYPLTALIAYNLILCIFSHNYPCSQFLPPNLKIGKLLLTNCAATDTTGLTVLYSVQEGTNRFDWPAVRSLHCTSRGSVYHPVVMRPLTEEQVVGDGFLTEG